MAKKEQSYQVYLLKQKLVPYLFMLPNLIIFGLFIITPAIMGIYFSMTSFRGLGDSPEFIGLANYRALVSDEHFLAAMWNTIRLVLVTLPVVFIISLGLAVIISKPLRARGLYRAVYYWPVMISFIVAGLIGRWIFHDTRGYVNGLLTRIGDWGLWDMALFELPLLNRINPGPIAILSDPTLAWWGVVLLFVWSRAGYYMILFVAALLSVPPALYEAGKLDGANRVQRFFFITYPSIKPARTMVMILAAMEIFKIFPHIVAFTGGGPILTGSRTGATLFQVQYIYEEAFTYRNLGGASAMSMVMILMVMTFTGAVLLMSRRGGEA